MHRIAGWETSGGRTRRVIISAKIFVGNLNYDTSQRELEELFSQIGEIQDVFLPTDRDTGRPRGFAFVEFVDRGSVAEAIERFDGYELQGRNIRINEAEERQRRAPGFSDSGFPPKPKGGRGGKPKGSRRNLRSRKRGF